MPLFQKGIQLYLVHSFLCGFAQNLLYFNSIQEGLNSTSSTRNLARPLLNPWSYQSSVCNVSIYHFSFQSCLEMNFNALLLYFEHFHFQTVVVYAVNRILDSSYWYHLNKEQNCTAQLPYSLFFPFSAFFCMHL